MAKRRTQSREYVFEFCGKDMTGAHYFKAKSDAEAIRKAWGIFRKEEGADRNKHRRLFIIGLYRFKDPRFKTGAEWDEWNKVELPV